ncbi:MAG: ABC transporter permease [Caldilineaceae bacterium]|nr:ABC transporter permease [Caldilineaceae bacterium]
MNSQTIFRPILILADLIRLMMRSLISRLGLTLLNLFGIVLAVALLTSAAFFAQGVDRAILQQELATLTRQTGRDPFSLRVYVFPSARQPLSIANAEQVAGNLAGTLSAEIGLPRARQGLQVESGSLMLLPNADDERYSESRGMLGSVNVVYVADVADKMETVAGDPFAPTGSSSSDALDVWIHTLMAEEMGIHPGERFQLGFNISQPITTVRVVGFWTASDPADPFWFKNPNSNLRTALMVRRGDYINFIEPVLASKSRAISWHITLDDSGLNPALARQYVVGFNRAMAIIGRYLPDARLDISPLGPLQQFVGRQNVLTTMLLGFNLPSLVFLLYFLLLISAIVARRQQREISILRSRGMSKSTLVGMALIEQMLLFAVAAPLGMGLGLFLARQMGYTASFLTFTDRDPLPVSLQGLDLRLVAVALGVALLARLAPVVGMAARSVVQQEREHARQTRPPFWQRAYLDLLLVAPTVYVYRQLLGRGSFANPGATGADALFQDPLLVLAPALFVLTAALVTMRIFPPLMALLDWLAARAPWLTPHLVLRQLGRHSAAYVTPLLLVIVLLAMGIYTVSMAASLDRWLVERIYYSIGADARFLPMSLDETNATPLVMQKGAFDDLPGVAATARVGDYRVRYQTAAGRGDGRFLAVDRVDFPNVVWFRPDFAAESVGALMNRLALAPENILVSQRFLNQHVLGIGDQIELSIALDSTSRLAAAFTIAGVFTYFPTAYDGAAPGQPHQDLLIIGNLEALFFMAGSEFPHYVWLRMEENAQPKAVFDAVERTGIFPGMARNTIALVAAEQARLERVGIFGTLSIGFVAAAIMAILALLVHGFAALSERGYQFGVLRALGLRRGQVLTQVGMEYALITAYGALGGTLIGALAAFLFTPFFRITGAATLPLPPLIPFIAWDRIAALAVLFTLGMVIVEIVVITRSFRQRVFTTLRMGNPG